MLTQDVNPIYGTKTVEVRANKALSGMVTQNKGIRFFDNSTLENMRVCPRKFYFSQIRHFQPAGLRMPLIFGSSIHSALDFIWENISKYQRKELLQGAMVNFLEVWKAEGADQADELDIFPRTPSKALEILEGYLERYKGDLQRIELIGIEQPFIVPLSLDDETVFYIGKLDKIYKDAYGIHILDHKTASTISTTWINSFSPNGQVDGYLHAGYTTFGSEFSGVMIDGLLVTKTVNPKGDKYLRIPINRQPSQLDAWNWEVSDLIDMIELNEERLIEYRESGCKQNFLPAFPKCTTSCTQYYGTCPYLDLCKYWDDPEKHECPPNMVEKKWQPFEILENLDGTFKVKELEKGA